MAAFTHLRLVAFPAHEGWCFVNHENEIVSPGGAFSMIYDTEKDAIEALGEVSDGRALVAHDGKVYYMKFGEENR